MPPLETIRDPKTLKKAANLSDVANTATARANIGAAASGHDHDATYAPIAHKDTHDPEDGADALDSAVAVEVSVVVGAGVGSSHSFARADHVHAINHGITNNHIVTVDGTGAYEPQVNEYARWAAGGLVGRNNTEVLADIGAASSGHNHNSVYIDLTLADAKGDILVATGNNVWVALTVGSNAQVLTADSGEASGVKWTGEPTFTSVNEAYILYKTSENYGFGDSNVLGALTAGGGNNCMGAHTGEGLTEGSYNAMVGGFAGRGITVGNLNALFGAYTGYSLVTSDGSNVMLGAYAGYWQTSKSNILIIDNQQRTNEADEIANAFIYGDFSTPLLTINGALTIKDGNTFTSNLVDINGGTIDGVTIATDCTQTEWDAAYSHVGSSGADHTWIDQNVSSGAVVNFSSISAFTLRGKLTAGVAEIEGLNFDINGGAIDGTVIGASSAVAIKGKGYARNIVTKTANYTLAAADDTVLGNTNAFTLTLPDDAIEGKVYTLKKINTEYDEALTIGRNGKTIDGVAANYVIYTVGSGVVLQYDGSANWSVIGAF